MTSSAVTFRNRAGHALFGILESPERPRPDVAVLLLSPGIKSRVAPHRLYVKMARRFTARGLRVLRFDFEGLGDSEGTLPERQLADLYRAIQLGRCVDDTHAAIAWMQTTYGVSRVLLAGLCGGGITGLFAAASSPPAAGVFAIGLPVALDGTAVDKVAVMSHGQLRGVRAKYLKKITDPASWWRLLTLRTDLRLLARAFGRGPQARSSRESSASMAVLGDNGNPRFPGALIDVLERSLPVMLVFSGADRLYWEYKERFADPHAGRLAAYDDRLTVRVIDHANHVLTFEEWQQSMLRHADDWVTSCLGAAGSEAS